MILVVISDHFFFPEIASVCAYLQISNQCSLTHCREEEITSLRIQTMTLLKLTKKTKTNQRNRIYEYGRVIATTQKMIKAGMFTSFLHFLKNIRGDFPSSHESLEIFFSRRVVSSIVHVHPMLPKSIPQPPPKCRLLHMVLPYPVRPLPQISTRPVVYISHFPYM
jgi:hypothetical protein